MEERKPDIKKSILLRVRMLYLLFFLVGVAIVGKILYIQYGPSGETLRSKGERITYERVSIEANRGDVLSWDGRILATSIPMYEVRMDFGAQGLVDSVFTKNVDSLAVSLSRFFGNKSADAYRSMLQTAYRNRSKNRFTLISPRRVNHLEIKEISQFPLFRLGPNRGGFIAVSLDKRLKPHGSMASRTIGMVNEAGTKVGIEGAYDSILRGVNGNVMMERISGSFRIPIQDEYNVAPVNGIDVVTTLDIEIQDVAETALRQQLEVGDADWGTVILMEVATGEVRAIANLTRKGEGRYLEDFNYGIGMSLEPGSTFKLATLMTLLDEGGAKLNERFNTGDGTMMVGRVKVVDTHACGELPLSGIFEHSSNIGFALATNKYFEQSPERFVNHIRKMGLDQPFNLQIQGEVAPVIHQPGSRWWNRTTLTMMSYGYALRLTPMKTLSLYNAVANNGKMMRPLFVKEFRQYGQTLRTFSPDVMVSSVASNETIKEVQSALESVVDDGTARILKNPYYKVAGKTGTAQIALGKGGYTDNQGGRHYLATLVGYFPADNPKYSCIVCIKTYNGPGRRNSYYGASLSGPVFRAIADRVYAQHTDWQPPLSKQKSKLEEQPTIKGGRTEEIKRVTKELKVTLPKSSEKSEWESIRTNDSVQAVTPLKLSLGVVPNVIGMGLKEALYLLETEGLMVSFRGVGGVLSQSLPAGSPAERGALIVLQLGIPREEEKTERE